MANANGRILAKEAWIQKSLINCITTNRMKISVSNIAWDRQYFIEYLRLLKSHNCSGVEIAPSIIWPEPINSSSEERKNFRKKVNNEGLEIVGFHALLFSRPDLQFFKTKESRKSAISIWLTRIGTDLNRKTNRKSTIRACDSYYICQIC